MTGASVALIAAFVAVMFICVKPLGLYIANVMEGRPILGIFGEPRVNVLELNLALDGIR